MGRLRVLAATLSTIPGIPVAALAVIFGIDRFMSMGRAFTNLIGNGVATIVVSEWEKEMDKQKMMSVLYGEQATADEETVHVPATKPL